MTTDSIPINSYIAVVGVHTSLWTFTALYLPRTTFANGLKNTEWDQQLSSRDRPQHPFLVALTQNPTWTLTWICLGAGLVQSWWAGRVRRWWLDLSIQGTQEEKRLQRAILDRKKLTVRLHTIHQKLFCILKMKKKIRFFSKRGRLLSRCLL
jgi:phosphatidylinositol glycan class F